MGLAQYTSKAGFSNRLPDFYKGILSVYISSGCGPARPVGWASFGADREASKAKNDIDRIT